MAARKRSDTMKLRRLKPALSNRFTAGLPFPREGKKPGRPVRPERDCGDLLSQMSSLLTRCLILSLLLLALAASASARQLKIQKFSAEIFVQPDSSLDVTETIEANFI